MKRSMVVFLALLGMAALVAGSTTAAAADSAVSIATPGNIVGWGNNYSGQVTPPWGARTEGGIDDVFQYSDSGSQKP